MSKAHNCLVIANEQQITVTSYLKRILRIISDDDVVIVFSDGSRLIYQRHKSWRFDKFIVEKGKADESL